MFQDVWKTKESDVTIGVHDQEHPMRHGRIADTLAKTLQQTNQTMHKSNTIKWVIQMDSPQLLIMIIYNSTWLILIL